jgi:hypothetical protein
MLSSNNGPCRAGPCPVGCSVRHSRHPHQHAATPNSRCRSSPFLAPQALPQASPTARCTHSAKHSWHRRCYLHRCCLLSCRKAGSLPCLQRSCHQPHQHQAPPLSKLLISPKHQQPARRHHAPLQVAHRPWRQTCLRSPCNTLATSSPPATPLHLNSSHSQPLRKTRKVCKRGDACPPSSWLASQLRSL